MTVKETVKETADKATGKVRETYEATRTRVGDTYEAASAKAGEAYTSARERASAAGRTTADTVNKNPLSALVGGLAFGALIGALLPKTRRETELMGPYGSKITDRARDAAQAARAAGQEKLDEIGIRDTAKDAAKKVVGEARAVASEAGSAAAKKARGEE